MNKRIVARVLPALLLMLGILTFGFTPAASAAPAPALTAAASIQTPARIDGAGPANTTQSVCGTTAGGSSRAASNDLLPVNRWADATAAMHSRLDNTFLSDTAELMQRHSIISTGMSSGNFMWSLGTGMSAFAINFCMLDKVGGAADGVVATIGNAIKDSALLTGLVVMAVVILLFQGRKNGQMPWKKIAQKGVVIGLFAAMTAGAMASTGGGKSNDSSKPYSEATAGQPYTPGFMSPGWIVTTINDTVSSLASAPAGALVLSTTGDGSMDMNNPLSCDNYLLSLKMGYKNAYGDTAESLASGVPLIMSSLWETTGLQTWRTAQFGDSKLDENSWCRLLEYNAGTRVMSANKAIDSGAGNSESTVRATMNRIMPAGRALDNFNYSQIAFVPSSKADTDKSLVAWASCRFANAGGAGDLTEEESWKVADHFTGKGDKDKKANPADCASWFTADDDHAGSFNWDSDQDKVVKRTITGPGDERYALDVRDFILTLHGNNNSQGMTSVFAYNISALSMLVVFGLLAISILIAKIAMVVMIITGIFMVILALMPSAGFDKMGNYLKTLLGINLFTFAVQLLFAMISILTVMLQSLGTSFLGEGSLVAIFWSGLSPLLSVFLLHMVFTKVLKVPSPFKLSAAMAWGGAVGAAGGAALGGVGALMDRKVGNAGRRAMSKATGAGKRGVNSVLGKATGGRIGGTAPRRGAAAPAGLPSGAKGASAGSVDGGLPGALQNGRRGKSSEQNHMVSGEEAIQNRLLTSNTPNSEVAKGRMSSADRKIMADAAKAELAAAKQFRKDQRAEMGLSPEVTPGSQVVGALSKTVAGAMVAGSAINKAGQTGKRIVSNPVQSSRDGLKAAGAAAGAAKAAVKSAGARATVTLGNLQSHPIRTSADLAKRAGGAASKLANSKAVTAVRYSNAVDQFKQKPLRTTAKVAGAGLLLATSTPALAIPAVAAGAWAAKKGVQEANRRTLGRKAANDQMTAEYRQAALRQRSRESRVTQPEPQVGPGPEPAPETSSESSNGSAPANRAAPEGFSDHY
ncbi:tripartite tricarboxylate transporter TctB family protein [Arthrobacter caoxuetaonis]|uniref:TrbL/VirB6 plasmid conjugal transfer protein n=1 Tax=Arthrobacter caoxuetaonis TaxID=2886935 RepID=A0A9X1MHT6_9MICC|nr:hypothetical protein [Arthrobacter caoxuetaonis]MCC3299475.1 hypothetical protein [Arthrobacter caoxuetaonis]USQ59033.1 hypothetical protein NF551_18175 [Arthrobacter caoxuetaonis]